MVDRPTHRIALHVLRERELRGVADDDREQRVRVLEGHHGRVARKQHVNRVGAVAIEHGGNLAVDARAARGALAELVARLGSERKSVGHVNLLDTSDGSHGKAGPEHLPRRSRLIRPDRPRRGTLRVYRDCRAKVAIARRARAAPSALGVHECRNRHHISTHVLAASVRTEARLRAGGLTCRIGLQQRLSPPASRSRRGQTRVPQILAPDADGQRGAFADAVRGTTPDCLGGRRRDTRASRARFDRRPTPDDRRPKTSQTWHEPVPLERGLGYDDRCQTITNDAVGDHECASRLG